MKESEHKIDLKPHTKRLNASDFSQAATGRSFSEWRGHSEMRTAMSRMIYGPGLRERQTKNSPNFNKAPMRLFKRVMQTTLVRGWNERAGGSIWLAVVRKI